MESIVQNEEASSAIMFAMKQSCVGLTVKEPNTLREMILVLCCPLQFKNRNYIQTQKTKEALVCVFFQ